VADDGGVPEGSGLPDDVADVGVGSVVGVGGDDEVLGGQNGREKGRKRGRRQAAGRQARQARQE
jgi:hypothetical protein